MDKWDENDKRKSGGYKPINSPDMAVKLQWITIFFFGGVCGYLFGLMT